MSETYAYTAPGIVAGITPTDADHIFFDANQNSAMGEDFPRAHYIKLRGIVYGVSAHLHRWKDGSWNIGKEEASTGTRLYHFLWITRADATGANRHPSDAVRQKAAELITTIVREWVTLVPEALPLAQRGAAEAKLVKVRARIAELEADLRAAEAEAEALRAQLAKN